MREDVPDVDALPSVLDHRDERVLVSADVEHRESAHSIGIRKAGTDSCQMPPCSSLGYAVPIQQRLQRVLMCLAEFGDRSLTDHPHPLKVTKTVTRHRTQAVALPANARRAVPRSARPRAYTEIAYSARYNCLRSKLKLPVRSCNTLKTLERATHRPALVIRSTPMGRNQSGPEK